MLIYLIIILHKRNTIKWFIINKLIKYNIQFKDLNHLKEKHLGDLIKNSPYCPYIQEKGSTARKMIDLAIEEIKNFNKMKMNVIWLEATGCSGNIISLMNADYPDFIYLLQEMVVLKYNNTVMAAAGDAAFEKFLETLDTEFILVVEGAVSTKDNGKYTVIARNQDTDITALDAVKMAGEKAKYVIAVGTCASFGGVSSASPNPSGSVSVSKVLTRQVINVPGCPCHPDWVLGTIANILYSGKPELDDKNRPLIFYGITIHTLCQRRAYFDNGVFATKLGDPECMFKLGCKGPVTKTDCPLRQWNSYVNWPVKANAPCIGCAGEEFPDGMEPFITF